MKNYIQRSRDITNILLTVLIILGGTIGTMLNTSMSNIEDSVNTMEESISTIKVFNGKAEGEHDHLRELIYNHETRISKIEEIKRNG